VKVRVSTRGGSRPASSESGSLEITVSDTGIGITEEKIPRIFDRFYRVDETHTTEGTGIGLALTKELVELHHGTIVVQSTPGEGSVFTVRLPIQQSAYAPDETVESGPQTERREYPVPEASVVKPESAAPAPPAGGKPIVLIVEDNADLRAYIREYLEAEYAVQEALDGKTGYDRAVEFVPDIVISDVMMPEMDGIELCRALKQDVRTSHVPVILLTARADADSKIEGLEIGADDYVTKPFDSKELVARVHNLIDQRRQLRKKFSAGVVLKPGEVAVSSLDDAFLQKAISIVEKRLSDEKFTVEELAVEMGMSRVQVHRKLTALTNQSASEFIRYMRLHRGMELLRKNAGTVSEIAYMVGFGKPSNFARWFQEQFGVLPSSVTKDVAGKSVDRNT
jgi:DNA-binding response OmpR family regulator